MPSHSADKGALRRAALARLGTLPGAERAAAGDRIACLLWEVPEVAGAQALLLYASLPEEVPTDTIAREALARGIAVLYPRVVPNGELELHRVGAVEELRRGRWKIREPDPALHPVVPVEEADAALVPGLAWDRSGGRLGRGAGYYDRLLAHPAWRGFRCGLFWAAQEVGPIPTDPWDVPLDAVLTERRVWRPLPRTAPPPTPDASDRSDPAPPPRSGSLADRTAAPAPPPPRGRPS